MDIILEQPCLIGVISSFLLYYVFAFALLISLSLSLSLSCFWFFCRFLTPSMLLGSLFLLCHIIFVSQKDVRGEKSKQKI